MGFIIICSFGRVEPSGELFEYFFTTNCDPRGWISILPRVMKEGCLLVSKESSIPKVTTTSLMFSGDPRIQITGKNTMSSSVLESPVLRERFGLCAKGALWIPSVSVRASRL